MRMSVLGLSSPNVPAFINENNNEFTTIETDIDFNFEGEPCGFFGEGGVSTSAVYKGESVFPQVTEDPFGFVQKNERQISPQAIWDVDSFVECNSTKLRNNLKRPQTAVAAAMFEMPSLKRSAPCFDVNIDVSLSQEAIQECVADYFNNRGGITFEFCPAMQTWSVLIFHGAQMCALSFKMAPAGSASEQQVRFSGRLENGSTALETLHSTVNTLQGVFEARIASQDKNNTSDSRSHAAYKPAARKPHSLDYKLPCNQPILDMMIALAGDSGNLTRQQEAVQCLSEMSLDGQLLRVMHDRGATQALLAAYEACAKEAPPADIAQRAAYFTALFSESAPVSHAKHEIALFALSALANFSAHTDAMRVISSAQGAWAKLCALHKSFTAVEQCPCEQNASGVVSVKCLVNSAERLRRRAMHRLSSVLQEAFEDLQEQDEPFCGSPLVRTMSFAASPSSAELVRRVSDMRV